MRVPVRLFLFFAVAAAAANAQPTYSREVSRILQDKCQRCHRPGDIAPFALMNYQDASTWAEDIRRVVEQRIMPPWKPVPGHGEFRDDYGLSDEQRQTVIQWAAAGAPEGDPADLPEPLPETGEWQLGEPDVVLTMAEPFEVPRGKDLYRCFALPTNFDEDRFLRAVEVKPGNRQIVHHVLLFLDLNGDSVRKEGKDGYPGYDCFGGPGVALDLRGVVGAWVPGMRTHELPEGIGIQIPKGARVVMQIHYYPAGRPGPDQSKLGAYFVKSPVKKRLMTLPVVNTSFAIPPGNAAFPVTATFPVFPFADMKVVAAGPHMHLLGRKIRMEFEHQGRTTPLIRIDDWDFNWQGNYQYKEPIAIPAGSRIRLFCEFDNSAGNPRNPSNPLKTVRWGEGTEDEMCLGFLSVTFDYENLLPFTAGPQQR
jgi:hypothetical protein